LLLIIGSNPLGQQKLPKIAFKKTAKLEKKEDPNRLIL